MKTVALAGAALASFAMCLSGAQAQVAYGNSALNGCYAHLSTSVDTGATTVGRNVVGTICFDGKGHVIGTTSKPALSGGYSNTDGAVHTSQDHTETYSVTNSPGDGMGVLQGKCGTHGFVLKNIDANGLAHGFSYILLTKKKSCKDDGPLVAGGNAEYQGPLK